MTRQKVSFATTLLVLLLVSLPLLAQPGITGGARPTQPAGDPVEPGIWRLGGISPGLPTTDLEPLRPLIGKATVVGMGESIHTSGGYYTAKHRVFRFLVERLGFRAIAFETPWAGAEGVATYVQTCQGSLEDAMQGLRSEWHSAEVRDLVQWMCDWNRKHKKPKDRLHFAGFDIQQPETDGPALIAFLQRIGVTAEDPLVQGVLHCDGVSAPPAPPGGVSEADNLACLAALAAVTEKFTQEARTIIKRTSAKDFEWAKVRLVGLQSSQGYNFYLRSNSVLSDEARDFGMAYVLRAMQTLRFPKKTKAVAWAANFHLSKAPLLDPNGIARTMGTFLTESLGASYFVLGLIGWDVFVDMPPGLCGVTHFASARSLEAKLNDMGEDYLLIDPSVQSSVINPDETQEISGSIILPRDHYNALLYLDESAKMTPLYRPPC